MFHTENTQHAEADLSRTPAWLQLQQPEDDDDDDDETFILLVTETS